MEPKEKREPKWVGDMGDHLKWPVIVLLAAAGLYILYRMFIGGAAVSSLGY